MHVRGYSGILHNISVINNLFDMKGLYILEQGGLPHCISWSKAVYPSLDSAMFKGGGTCSSEVKKCLFSRDSIGKGDLGKRIRFTQKDLIYGTESVQIR